MGGVGDRLGSLEVELDVALTGMLVQPRSGWLLVTLVKLPVSVGKQGIMMSLNEIYVKSD